MDKKETLRSAHYSSATWLVGVLTVYFFIFLISELMINDRASVVLGSSSVVTNYSIGIIFTALGYLAFALSRGIFEGDKPRRIILGAVGILYFGAMSAILFFAPPSLFTVITCVCTLCLGYMGGFVHYHAAVALQGSNYTGRIIGSSYFGAVSLQYVVQSFAVTKIALIYCVAFGMILLFAVILRPPRDWLFENPLPYERVPTATRSELWLTALIVALMSALAGIYDGAITSLHAAGKINLAGWPRMLLALGELFAGILYDVRRRIYMPLIALCTTLIFAMSIVFLYATPNLSMALHYFCAGFYIIFLTVSFIDLAPRTSNPALWAGMGRISRSIFVGISAAPSGWFFATAEQNTIITLNVILFTIILFLFWHKGDLIPDKSMISERTENKQTVESFAAKYQFTPRETEVMAKIIASDKGAKELATEINISERVLYRYFNSLYEKTGTSSRVGLLLLYYNKKEQSD